MARISLTLIQTFYEVASKGSFSGAARELNLSYQSAANHVRRLEQILQDRLIESEQGAKRIALTPRGRALYNPLSDYNAWPFPADFLAAGQDLPSGLSTPELEAAPGQEVWLRVVQPAGRARQRAFLSTGPGYSDLFPGFGSGHSALLSARKSVTAAFRTPDWPATYLWRDGPSQHVGGGVWGRFVVRDPSAQSAQQPPQQ